MGPQSELKSNSGASEYGFVDSKGQIGFVFPDLHAARNAPRMRKVAHSAQMRNSNSSGAGVLYAFICVHLRRRQLMRRIEIPQLLRP
jgi:hypothetical protein